VALILMTQESPAANLFVGDILYVVPLVGSVVAAVIAVRRSTGRSRTLWRLLAVAYTAQLAGELIWAGYDYLSESGPPQPSIADLGYVISSVATLIAILVGFGGTSGLRQLRGLIDTAVIVLGLGAATWHVLIEPQMPTTTLTLGDLISLAYPVLDTALLCCLLIIGLGGHARVPLSVRLIGLAGAVNAISDLGYTFTSITTGYDSGGWIDAAFEAGAVCGFVAAVIAVRTAEPEAAPRTFDRGMTRTPVVLSSIVVVTLLATQKARTGDVDTTTLSVSGVLFLGVLLRQYLFTTDRAVLAEELRRAVVEQQRLAVTDSLTGLYNRRFVNERLGDPDRGHQPGPVSVLIIDLDHFKQINDTYGHLHGDTVLREAAARITAACRAGDVAARWGGEEFLILLPGTDEADAALIAEHVRQEIAGTPVILSETAVTVTASIGVASGPYATDDPLVSHADQALYEAKRTGRNRVVAWSALPPAPEPRSPMRSAAARR
jgi:two-component system, cell cycle response regulator